MEISQPARPESSSLVSIQALRAVAALLVFWGHAINAVNLGVARSFRRSTASSASICSSSFPGS
jgi:peptidoglycan/LPS O-acetylase OafA/YrhL